MMVAPFAPASFAFSTILGWSYYGERALEYLGGKKTIPYYRILWVIAVFIGSIINVSLIWQISDTMNALMAIPNLISLILLLPCVFYNYTH